MDADSLCVDQVALTDAEVHEELFHAARRRLALTWEPTDEQQRRLEDRAAEAEFSPVTPERIAERALGSTALSDSSLSASAIATKWAGSGSRATWTPRLLPKLLPNHLTRAGTAVDTPALTPSSARL